MGYYHCEIKVGSKGQGASAIMHAEYICRAGRYSYKEDLEHTESGNMPAWALMNPMEFWRTADLNEGPRMTVYREAILALPVHLTANERVALAQEWVAENLQGHAFTLAVHMRFDPNLNEVNPHVHVMFTDRRSDGIERAPELFFRRPATPYRDRKTKQMVTPNPSTGGCGKAVEWNKRDCDHIIKVRESWARIQNQFFASKGLEVRVDHRSLVAQRDAARDEGDEFRAVLLDRPADQRVSALRWRFLERKGDLYQIRDTRRTNRIAAQAKAQELIRSPLLESPNRAVMPASVTPVIDNTGPVAISGGELGAIITDQFKRHRDQRDQWGKEAQKYFRQTPFTIGECEQIAKNQLLKQANVDATVESIEQRHKSLIQEKQRLDKYYHDNFDVSASSHKADHEKIWIKTQLSIPFSSIFAKRKQFELWRTDFNNRVVQHNHERGIYNNKQKEALISNEVERLLNYDKLRLQKYNDCLANEEYHRHQCERLNHLRKFFIQRAAKHLTHELFMVRGKEIEQILETHDLSEYIERRLELAKRRERQLSREHPLGR